MFTFVKNSCALLLVVLLHCVPASIVCAQGGDDRFDVASEPKWTIQPLGTGSEVVISEEQRVIDPVTLLPEKLSSKLTVDFDEVSLSEFARWLEAQLGMPVVVAKSKLSDAGVDPDQGLISEQASKLPACLLLERVLRNVHGVPLTWYLDEGVIYITATDDASSVHTTQAYALSELIERGFQRGDITVLTRWPSNWMGDILFVRCPPREHLYIQGLFAALRSHGRETAVLEPAENAAIRDKLDEPITVALPSVPLSEAAAILSEMTGIQFKLDKWVLTDAGVAEDTEVSVSVKEAKLSTVLRIMLDDVGGVALTALPRDGTLVVTTLDSADADFRTVVYDVRDLCRNGEERDYLAQLIQDQAEEMRFDGKYSTFFALSPGTLVARETEAVRTNVRELLAKYRQAIKVDGRPTIVPVDMNELITRYYRVPLEMGEPLAKLLPQLVASDTWQQEGHSEGGEINVVPAGPDLVDLRDRQLPQFPPAEVQQPASGRYLIPQAVLVIRQTRSNHVKIGRILKRMHAGDPLWLTDQQAHSSDADDGSCRELPFGNGAF